MKRFKKDNKRLIILIAVLALVIGYALVSTSLNITSSIFVKSAKWDIHFENVKVADGSATTENGATIKNKTTVEFSVGLNSPGEFYEFTVDAKNDGLIDGIIDDVTFDVYDPTGETKLNDDEIPSYVFKSITYEDGTEINKQDILRSGKKKVYKIRVAYTDEIEEKDINKDFSCMFKASVKYKQSGREHTPNATFVANTNPNLKGLIGTAYLNPTDYYADCTSSSQTEIMPIYVATSNAIYDDYADENRDYPGNYYNSATSWARNNSGCMKWYVYKDTGNAYKMILDHNTTVLTSPVLSGKYYDSDSKVGGTNPTAYCLSKYNNIDDVISCTYLAGKILKRDTNGWEDENATMIERDEIIEIIERETPERLSDYNIDLTNGYEWLIDNMEGEDNHDCLEPSCYSKGYWTKEKGFECEGTMGDCTIEYLRYELHESYSVHYPAPIMSYIKEDKTLSEEYGISPSPSWVGIRPVITVPKSYFK